MANQETKSHGTVLITRPADVAARTAAQVRARGWTPLVVPLLSIRFLPVTLPSAADYDSLIFTSAQGVAAFAALRPDGPEAFGGLAVYAVGPQTAAAARRAGFTDVRTGPGDARGLEAELRADPAMAAARYLHLSGETAAHVFSLPRAARLVLYAADAADALPRPRLDYLENKGVDAALFYSPRSAALFAGLLERHGLTRAVLPIKALCLADSVVKLLEHLPWQDIRIASSPDGEGMMAALDGLVPPGSALRRP